MKASHITWNLAGLGLPLLAAAISIPPLLRLLGQESFGLLSLVWAVTALSGLFDLGIGRATTRNIADLAGKEAWGTIRSTIHTALKVTWISGLIGALLLLALTLLDLHSLLKLQATSKQQLHIVIALLALCIPIQTLIATYRGVSEGLQQFRGINLARMVLGCGNFFVPWTVALLLNDIAALTASLVLTRLTALLAFRWLAKQHLSLIPTPEDINATPVHARTLLSDGGWLSISALVSPVLVQADRFLIASLISAAAVSAYTVPFDMVTQLLSIVSAVAAVAFPAITSALSRSRTQAAGMFRRWLMRIIVGMGLLTGMASLLLPSAFDFWMGDMLKAESIVVGRWLCLGVWINSVGAMYYSWLHAHGRYRSTATLHLLELPAYLLLLTVLLQGMGVVGAAIAWVLRVSADTLGLYLLSLRTMRPPLR